MAGFSDYIGNLHYTTRIPSTIQQGNLYYTTRKPSTIQRGNLIVLATFIYILGTNYLVCMPYLIV